jgi:formylglycine-generating enzyme required for sulfatase activity
MSHFLRVILIVPITCLCAGGTERSHKRQSDAPQALCGDSPAEERVGHKGKEILGPGLGEFIFIPGGQFTMGRNNGENADQRPEHVVELSSFYVGRTPVANSQFVRFLNEAQVKPNEYLYAQMRRRKPSVTLAHGKWSSVQGTENDAACGESWALVQRYCDWLSAKTGRKCRLPTEAEWEYVCRGKEGRKLPWGNDERQLGSKVWRWRTWRSDKPNRVPVGSFPKGATPEGVCDLVGYMDEMCSDWYDPEYYSKSPRTNPRGPSEPVQIEGYRSARVLRGGLQHSYTSKGAIQFFRESKYFGVLPSTYLPRGWSRDYVYVAGTTTPSTDPDQVYGRLGFRVVVEEGGGRASGRH